MRIKRIALLMVVICCALTATGVFAEQSTERRPPKEKWTHETVQAIVESINSEIREVILRGPEGDLLRVEVDGSVERFDEIRAGDVVEIDYWEYMLAEFRDPTPEEQKEPLVVIAEAGKAPKDVDPSAAVGAVIRAVVTIEIINRPNMTVTVKGPRGNFVTVDVEDKALIEKLNVGEVGILTYAEALALSLEKVK
jgi:hypothetical protein